MQSAYTSKRPKDAQDRMNEDKQCTGKRECMKSIKGEECTVYGVWSRAEWIESSACCQSRDISIRR